MTIAIHSANNSFSERWIKYCNEQNIPYKIVNCYSNDIISQLEGCDALLWHHHHAHQKDIVFAKQLLFALEQTGMKVFPNFNTNWYFDDKLGQKYLLEKAAIPSVPTYVFYSREEALRWIKTTTFPKVFKLRGGAGSANVQLVQSEIIARNLINRAFGKGFSQYDSFKNLAERYRKYRTGKTDIKDVLIGVARIFKTPAFSRIAGRQMGYIYFQDFIPNNDHDIRVIVIADRAFAIKRMVRKNDFRASGGGDIFYEKELFDENVIKLAFEINKKLKTQCLALDFIFDNDIPKVVEISFGFAMSGYDPCTGYWDNSLKWHPGKFNPYGWMIDSILQELSKAGNK